MNPGGFNWADVGRRNLENARRQRGTRKKEKLPTLRQEARELAEQELARILETRKSDPEVARIASLVEERNRLRNLLDDPERVFGTARAQTGEFGQARYTVPEKTIRRTFKAQEPRRATARLVGAEDTVPGEIYFP